MQKTFNIIFKAVLIVFTAVVAAACITEKFDTSTGLQSVMLQVNIEAGEMTKADPTAAESVINSVRIYAFRNDGYQVGHYYRAAASDSPILMDLTLPMTGIHDVEFHVFVNEKSMDFMDDFTFTEKMTKAQLSEVKFHNVIPTGGFPMYCVQTEAVDVEYLSSAPNQTYGHEDHNYLAQQVTFDLIRPIAKVSVYAAMVEGGTAGSVSVNRVEFAKTGTRAYNYLLPQTDAVLSTVPSRSGSFEFISSPVSLMKTIDKTDETAVKTPGNYNLIVADQYLAETEAGGSDWQTMVSDRQALLHVEYTLAAEGIIEHGYVYLPKIVRNHHYKVCILINSEGGIIINYTVADWDNADMTELWFDYPMHSYLRIAPNETDFPADPASMSATHPFVGYFKMSYPIEETWTPVLLNHSTECELKVYKVGSETTPLTYPIKADSDNWYKIVVTPDASLAADSEVEMAITYSPQGSMDKYEYLMINGSQNNYHWPYAGTSDPNKVIIKVN